jgi:acyl-CoA synthetase (NDP forming)
VEVQLSVSLSADRLATLLRPRTIALVGASNKSTFSRTAYANLVRFGLADHTHLVNVRGVETHGRPTVRSCAEIGEPVDTALMMVPQAVTLDAITEAAAAGITNLVMLTSGYGEAGPAGRRAQQELVAHAAALGVVLLGPNMLGFANFVDRVPLTSIGGLPQDAGPVALLSQSGASSGAMLDFASAAGVGLSYMVTVGNEAMVTVGHLIDFLVDDETTRAIAVFMETVRDVPTFRRACLRAAEKEKAIVVLKAGSSALSARTAAAHTGALVGDDATIDAMFRDLGIIRVKTIEDMLITAGAAATIGPVRTPGLGIVSISGGACDILADRAEECGAVLPELSEPTAAALTEFMPSYGTVQNPLDVTGAAVIDPTLFTRSIETLAADPTIGSVLVVSGMPWRHDEEMPYVGQVFLDAIGAGMARAAVPTVLVSQVMQPITDITRKVNSDAGILFAVAGLSHAISSMARLADWSQRLDDLTTPTPWRPTSPPSGRRPDRPVVRGAGPHAVGVGGDPRRTGCAGDLGRRGGRRCRRFRRPGRDEDRLPGDPAQDRRRRSAPRRDGGRRGAHGLRRAP